MMMSDNIPSVMTFKGTVDGGKTHFDMEYIRKDSALRVIALAKEVLNEGVRAIGDHNAPSDCYATGPLTGNHIRDLVECPACSSLALSEIALSAIEAFEKEVTK